jgi:hypothetical protein
MKVARHSYHGDPDSKNQCKAENKRRNSAMIFCSEQMQAAPLRFVIQLLAGKPFVQDTTRSNSVWRHGCLGRCSGKG